MDPGTAIAVVDISAKIISIITKYYTGVKNAKAEVQQLFDEMTSFHGTLGKVQQLVESRGSSKLPASAATATAVEQSLRYSRLYKWESSTRIAVDCFTHNANSDWCYSELVELENRSNPTKRGKMMGRVGMRALAWPLTRKQADDCITKLERHKATLSVALNTDQTDDKSNHILILS